MSSDEARELWTYSALAKAYSLSPRTLRRLVAKRILETVKIGGAVRITERSRRAWADSILPPEGAAGGEGVAA